MAEPTPPERTEDQRQAALLRANQIRAQRSTDKQRLRQGGLDARELLRDPPEHWLKARAADVMLAVPAIGHTKVERILRQLQISPSRTLQGLTPDQRQRLIRALDYYCDRVRPRL